MQVSPADLIAEVNNLRITNGLQPYSENQILMETAQGQADYMAATGAITHSGPGGISLTQRLLNAGYPLAGDLSLGGFRAENITGGPNKTAAQAVQEWTGDAPHLNTMLSPNLQEIGAGVAKVGDIVYLVIDCARPTSSGQPQAYTPSSEDPPPSTYAPSDFMVPVVASTPDQRGDVFHEVQYGQTLWSLALAYGVKIEEIRALNSLGADEIIYQGQRLLIRKDAPSASPTMEPPSAMLEMTITAAATFTPIPGTSTPPPATMEPPDKINGSASTVGIVVGITLAALLLAGLFSHFAAQKSL
jgi:hypothetical protein